MKHLSLTLCAIAIAILSNAQISQGGSPLSWQTDKIDLSELRFHTMPSFDEIIMRAEDDINNTSKDVPFRFGKNFDVNLGLSDGEWTDLPNGDRLWNLGIESIGAFSLNFLFSTFNLPEGGKLFIYNEDKSYKIGAFTSENNTPEKTLPTYPLPGERIILEYYEPAASAGLTELKIGRITHGYRDLDVIARGIGDSGTCNNNVICAEGDDWRDEINAVAMIVVGSNGICTGALVNNTANDGHPYFLTANHCTGGGVTNWVFRFNWQSPACGDNNPTENTVDFQTVSGSAMLAQGTSADYALLEINSGNPIPLAYNPYYAGWDASGVNPTSQVGIHHPSGDLKKISFDTNPAGTASYGGATNWRIFNWEDGTTEPGSSGSPLFDQNHNIIGQLFGGEATCNNNVNDYYGKFDITYPNVCQWLAPGCNTTVVDGFNPDTPTSSIDLNVQSITGASGVFCSDAITPSVVVRNAGSSSITSFTLNYDVDGTNSQLINWTGSLTTGNSVTLNIGSITGIASGNHTFNASTSSPNGGTDENTSNDTGSSNFSSVGSGSTVTLDILTDNYPAETTWEIIDQTNSSTVASGGPYTGTQTNYAQDICLANGCYELIFYDSFGDGMQYNGVVGNYILTDPLGNTLAEIVTGGNFGSQGNHAFCLTGTSVTASFSSDSQNVCVNSSIQFTDTSLGGPTTWNWTFPGGSPANSTDASPLVTYATPGTYDVSLTVANGALNDTETLTGYLTVTPSNTYYLDSDGDGYGSSNSIIDCSPQGDFNATITGDCNDNDVNINPGATEVCDGIDNNCNSQIDEGVSQITYYEDVDGDGFGSSNSIIDCSPQGDFNVTIAGDCNDNDVNINPGASESCDGIDNNCDSQIDEGVSQVTYYEDVDGDGFGSSNSILNCSPQGDFNATSTGDCNDNDVNINPGASESCDGIDNNCDSQIDEGVSQITYYEDLDGDGFGSGNSILNCSPQGDFNATSTGDCNDNDVNINPSSSEICGNNLDDNCDSLIDENQNTYYADSDLDGFGDLGSPILACDTSSGIVNNSLDCDDTNSNIYPNAPGSMEGLDNDCNGTIEGDELTPASCPGDFDGNNMVNITDLLVMLEVYGCNTGDCFVDMNGDGNTTIEDIGLFLSFFGSTCN